MKSKYALIIVVMLICGCAESSVDPCDLLTLAEVRRVAPQAQLSEYHPASTSKKEDNELCLWHDGGDQNVFMLFYYVSSSASPRDLVESGMPYDSKIIEVSGVGDTAVAGFVKKDTSGMGMLKMLAARSDDQTIGMRVRGISDEHGERFENLKELANTAFSRL